MTVVDKEEEIKSDTGLCLQLPSHFPRFNFPQNFANIEINALSLGFGVQSIKHANVLSEKNNFSALHNGNILEYNAPV